MPYKSASYLVFIRRILNPSPRGPFGQTTLPETAKYLTLLLPCDLTPNPSPRPSRAFEAGARISAAPDTLAVRPERALSPQGTGEGRRVWEGEACSRTVSDNKNQL